jgi:hypothetical protein
MTHWDEIREKCPKLYRKSISFDCGIGWSDIIRDLSIKIEEILNRNPDLQEICALQVKEKYGKLRFYLSDETEEIMDLVSETEAQSSQVCENCGMYGKIRNMRWLMVKCDKCFEEIKKR